MEFNDDLSLDSSANTHEAGSKFNPQFDSTVSSAGIHVAVRKTPHGSMSQPSLLPFDSTTIPIMDDDDSESEYSIGLLTKAPNRRRNQRRKPPVILPGKKKTVPVGTTRITGSLWATDMENDMHQLEEKYRIAAHKAQLNCDLERYETERDKSPVTQPARPSTGDYSDLHQPGSAQQQASLQQRRYSTDTPADDEYAKGSPSEEEKERAAEEEKKKKPASKSKAKLQNLNKFVLGHTARKVTSNWDLVENKFQASLTHDIIIVKGANGIGNPVKVKTLPLSSLTLLLCSPQLQLKFKELNTLYTSMKFSPAEVVRSCKIAARKLVLAASTIPEVQTQCQEEVTALLAEGEPKIRIDTLTECVFSSDPVDRKKEMAELEKARAERVQKLNDEKKRKKDNIMKTEARKRKSIFDFEASLGSVQYPRGLMNEKRLEHLRGIINFAVDILLEEFYERSVAVDSYVVDLMGPEMFPNTGDLGSPSASKEETKAAALEKAGFVRRDFPPKSMRIDLLGPPSWVELLRRAVALGKGIYGTSFNDVVELLQAYAATRMQTFFRGYTRRWRYRVARRAWKHMYNFMKSKIFKAWADEMRMMKNLRTHCFRKLTAWKYYTRTNLKRRHTFRVCYWPFFVWRRHAIETAKAREKSKFLVGRVYPTYITLSAFRGWKRYYLEESRFNKPADKYCLSLLKKQIKYDFDWWRYWLRRRKGMRRAWIERGYMMRCMKLEDSIRVPFQIWRAATTFKKRTEDFVKRNTHKFRAFLFPGICIHLPPVKVKLTDEDKKRLMDEVTLAEGQSAAADTLAAKKDRQMAKARLKALRRLKTEGDVDTSGKVVSLDKLQVMHRELGANFEWKSDVYRYDILSNKDELVNTSETLHNLYESFCSNFPEVVDVRYEASDYGMKWGTIRHETKLLVDRMRDRFYEAEIWNAVESACIYHRKAHRCFQNMRVHAIVSRNAKRTRHKYRDNLLRRCLHAFLRWATRGLDEGNDDAEGGKHATVLVSRAEELAFQVRTRRMNKLKKRRDVAKAYKDRDSSRREAELEKERAIEADIMSSKDISAADAGPRARQRRLSMEFKRINAAVKDKPSTSKADTALVMINSLVVDNETRSDGESLVGEVSFDMDPLSITSGIPFSGAFGVLGGDQDRPEEVMDVSCGILDTPSTVKSAPNEAPAEEYDLDNIDMLDWDRQERDEEMDLMQAMIKLGKEVTSETRKKVRQVAREAAKASTVNVTRDNLLKEVFEAENRRSQYSIEKELKYVDTFKIRMASNMVDVIAKVHGELLLAFIESQKRQYFRRLRLPLLLSRSIAMCNRKKLTNWIRLCKRLEVLYTKAPLFRSIKLKWRLFNRWLKFYEKENLDCSGGLISDMKRRAQMRRCLSDHLFSRGFKKTVYPRGGSLRKVGTEFISIFLRWKEYTQDSSSLKLIMRKVHALHRIRLLEKCFWAFRTNLSLKRSYDLRKNNHCFAYTRAVADTEQISKRYFSIRRKSLTYALRKFQHKVNRLLLKSAMKEVSFKQFVKDVKHDVDIRLMTEQKLLLTAFQKRGTAVYKDLRVFSKMAKPPGDKFNDPRTPSKHVDVPPGYLITKIKIAVQSGMGIVGWQLYWGADGCTTMEGTPRGKLIGSGINDFEYVLKPNDYLVEVEYVAEGNVMTGIRFRPFFGNWSRYFGAKPTQLSKKYILSGDLAKFENGEQSYQAAGRLETMFPGQPADYIIGFGGIETSNRCTSLNIIVRKIIQQNVFTYHFVSDAPKQMKRPRDIIDGDTAEEEGENAEQLPPVASAVPASRPPSSNLSVGIRNAKLAKHLADLQAWWPGDDSDKFLEPVATVTLTPTEEQFFDVIRMRVVEVKAAETRALQFARGVWTSMAMRNSSFKPMTGILVLSGLTRWLLEGLCKTLVHCPEGSEAVADMYAEAHSLEVQVEILENRVLSYNTSVNTMVASERFKPWYGKTLLGPQMRESKKAFHDELEALKHVRGDFQAKRCEALDKIDQLHEAALLMLPKFQLSRTVCKNFRLKIAAARYKSNLLEKMTMESLKQQLGGGRGGSSTYTFQLSGADLEKVRRNKALNDSLSTAVSTMDSLFAEDEPLKLTKQARQDQYARGGVVSFAAGMSATPSPPRLSATAPLPRTSKMPNSVANRILTNEDFSYTQTQKKTFRKFVAVNPMGGSVSKTPVGRSTRAVHPKLMPPIASRSLRSLTAADETV